MSKRVTQFCGNLGKRLGRSLGPALLMLSVASPGGAAVGPGQATVASFFGEPLDARARLSIPAGEAEAARVSIADYEAFFEHGLDRDLLPSDLQVGLDPGTGEVWFRTTRALREPGLSVLLRIELTGRIVFETVDLIVDARPAAATPVAAAEESRGAARRSRPVPPLPRAPRRARTLPDESRPGSGPESAPEGGVSEPRLYGPVQPGETLYRIAARVRPAGVSVPNMAMALFRANPKAFGRGNINILLAGAVLRVPSSVAAPIVARTSVSPAGRPGSPPPPSAPPVPRTARPVASSALAEEREELRAWLAQRQTERVKTAESNQKLKARFDRLQERLESIRERLIEQGTSVAQVRAQAGRIGINLGVPESPTPELEPAAGTGSPVADDAADAPALADAGGASDPLTVTEGAADAAAETAEPPAGTPAAVVAPDAVAGAVAGAVTDGTVAPSPEPGAGSGRGPLNEAAIKPAAPASRAVPLPPPAGERRNYFLEFASDAFGLSAKAGAILLLLLAGALTGLMMMRRVAVKAKRSISDKQFWAREAGLRSAVSAKAAQAAEEDGEELELDLEPDAPSVGRLDPGPGEAIDPAASIAASTEDTQVSFREADVYVAYGRFEDAAALLRQALEKDPDQVELQVKLAEVQFEAGDDEGFLETATTIYEALPETEGEAIWAHVAYLGSQKLPDHSLFTQRLSDRSATGPAASAESVVDYDTFNKMAARRRKRSAS